MTQELTGRMSEYLRSKGELKIQAPGWMVMLLFEMKSAMRIRRIYIKGNQV